MLLFATLLCAVVLYETGEWQMLTALYLLLVGLLYYKHFLIAALRLDEEGMTVVRAGLPHLHYPWQGLTVEYRPAGRRKAGGLLLEPRGGLPTFLDLNNLADEAGFLRELSRHADFDWNESLPLE